MNIFALLSGAIAICATLLAPVYGQDINFKDLNRTGPAVVKNYTVSGVAAEGAAQVLRFEGVDTARIARSAEQRQQYAAQAQSPSTSQTSSKGNSRSDSFVCTFVCEGGGVLTGKAYSQSNRAEVSVNAPDVSSARDAAVESGRRQCKQMGFHDLHVAWGKGQMSCSKR